MFVLSFNKYFKFLLYVSYCAVLGEQNGFNTHQFKNAPVGEYRVWEGLRVRVNVYPE